ncbi:hypothetical protein DYY67_1552 [Candidatus Nitrosotalea sp. TS]|nr:hypothetical protein [Candidatus Nitrosotalea sp. TS]
MTIQLDKSPPIYSTGSLVQISGTGAGQQVGVIISILASNSTLVTLDIQSTNRGDYSTEWLVPTSFSTGSYTVQVKTIVGTITTPITIQ